VERNKLTLRGLPTSPGYGTEVSRSHNKPETSCNPPKADNAEVSQKDEGLNVRMAKRSGSLWQGNNNGKHIREPPV
jgi:hypothetical protein